MTKKTGKKISISISDLHDVVVSSLKRYRAEVREEKLVMQAKQRKIEEDLKNIDRHVRHQEFIIGQLDLVVKTGEAPPWVRPYMDENYKPEPDDDPLWLLYEKLDGEYREAQLQGRAT